MRFSDLPPLARKIVVPDEEAVDRYFSRLAERSVNKDDHDDHEYVASVSLVPYAKNIGTSNLLGLFELRTGQVLVDVLGGAGQVAMAARRFSLCDRPEQIVTADEDVRHIVQALQQQLAALPLDPTDLRIVERGMVDHILIAHHVHHLSPDGRLAAIDQAARVLRPGGTLVIYEGPRGGSTAHISDTVVDELTNSPHIFPHPAEDELLRLADHPLLEGVRAVVVESPLIFLGQDEEQARTTALDYYIRHYSLHPDTPWVTLRGQIDEAYRRAGNGDEVYIGELPTPIEQKIFPSPADRSSHPRSVCVIVPRRGLAVITVRSAD